MKTKILIFIVFLSFLASRLSSCQDEISDATGSWVCNPEPDVTITLTFKSGKAYVSTSPQNLYGIPMPSGNTYLFADSGYYIVRGNTLNGVFSGVETAIFVGKMLSSSKMNLNYTQATDDYYLWIRDYTFEHK